MALSVAICWIGIVLSVAAGIVFLAIGNSVTGLLCMVIGSLASWIGSWTPYAIGETLELVTALQEDLCNTKKRLQEIEEQQPDKPVQGNQQPAAPEKVMPDKTDPVIQYQTSKDPAWVDAGGGFIVCPECGKHLAIDYMKARGICPHCGKPYAPEQ